MEGALRTFFSSPRFAVAGASSDQRKFGHKVFAWYLTHNLPVTPINPSCSNITVPVSRKQSTSTSPTANLHSTVANPAGLNSPSQYALSIITPPKITRVLLREAKEAGIRAVWLQPGSFDKEGLDFARKEWPDAAIAGEDVPGSRGGEGWCILVDGEGGMEVAGRGTKDGRL